MQEFKFIRARGWGGVTIGQPSEENVCRSPPMVPDDNAQEWTLEILFNVLVCPGDEYVHDFFFHVADDFPAEESRHLL